MTTHFEIRQLRARRQTVGLVVAYLLSYATVVYLTYSLMQALTHLAANDVERPRSMFLYLLGCPLVAAGSVTSAARVTTQ